MCVDAWHDKGAVGRGSLAARTLSASSSDDVGVEEAADDEAAYPAGAIEMRTYHKSSALQQ